MLRIGTFQGCINGRSKNLEMRFSLLKQDESLQLGHMAESLVMGTEQIWIVSHNIANAEGWIELAELEARTVMGTQAFGASCAIRRGEGMAEPPREGAMAAMLSRKSDFEETRQ